MKSILIVFFSFLMMHCFAQQNITKYSFDYFTVYDYKKSEKDTLVATKELNYSNSKDSSYVLQVHLENDIATKIFLVDYKNLKLYELENNKKLTDYKNVSFLKIKTEHDYSLKNCLKKSNEFYAIDYKNQSSGSIVINRFKSKERKKLVNQCFLETIASEIANNQHYNFSPLVAPLWCNKFVFKNKEIIINSYYRSKGNKEHIRKLLEISKTNLTIKIDSTNKIQQ